MLPLRYALYWGAVGWTGVAFAVFLTVLPAGAAPVPIGGPVQHISGYGLLTLWFLGLYPRARYLRIALWCFAFGAAMEGLQLFSPTRHPAVADALRNGLGIGAALGLAYAGLGGWALAAERLLGRARR